MGLMRFIVPPDRITEEAVEQAYLSGYDRIPWQTQARCVEGELHLERAVSDSATLHIPWRVEGYGLLTLSTSTLTERPAPYHLPLELARGKIGQVRNQLADWQQLGLTVSKETEERQADAVGYFAQAAVLEHGSQRSIDLAEEAIRAALETADLLTACYAAQALAIRRRGSQRLPAFLGADLGASLPDDYTSEHFLQAFDAACVPFCWRAVETSQGNRNWQLSDAQLDWCLDHRLKACGGPLLLLDERSIPDWLTLYQGDFDILLSFVSEFVESTVKRYRDHIDVWQCAARANTSDVLSLSEEEKIKLVVRSVELTRSLDPNTPIVVSFDQPWAEYLSRREMVLPPVHFADDLVRANLGLSALMLEINVGHYPGGTLPRDPLEFSRMLDHWSQLGVPLFLALSVPSDWRADPLALRSTKLPPGSWTMEVQQAWVSRYVPLLLAKPNVYGILWNQLRDAEPHDFAHSGLFDLDGRAKPALRQLATIRQTYLD